MSKKQVQAYNETQAAPLLKRMAKYKHIYVILIPTLLFYLIFCYLPMAGNIMAFQKYSITKGIFGSEFVGLKNFKSFLTAYNFWQVLKNTLLINIYDLIFGFPAPIILALLLNEIKNTAFKKTVQTITYMPHFISTVVIASMVLSFVSSEGLINQIREIFGLESISFMIMPQYFRTIYVSSNIWQTIGWGSIIYIAALAGVDQELYEAAKIDGAGRLNRIIHVTLPGIASTVILMFVLRIGSILEVGTEQVLTMYNPTVYETGDVIGTFVYRMGLGKLMYSYTTAVGLFNSAVGFILVIIGNSLSKRITEKSIW